MVRSGIFKIFFCFVCFFLGGWSFFHLVFSSNSTSGSLCTVILKYAHLTTKVFFFPRSSFFSFYIKYTVYQYSPIFNNCFVFYFSAKLTVSTSIFLNSENLKSTKKQVAKIKTQLWFQILTAKTSFRINTICRIFLEINGTAWRFSFFVFVFFVLFCLPSD